MEQLPEMLTPMTETIELLPMVKEAGHGLYYLSNYHGGLRNYIQKKYQFFDLFARRKYYSSAKGGHSQRLFVGAECVEPYI